MAFKIQRTGRHSEKLEEFSVSEWHALLFGVTDECDVLLTPFPALPDVCLRVWQDSDRCLAESLNGGANFVGLNGQPLDSVVELEPGDQLNIGCDRFVLTAPAEKQPEPGPTLEPAKSEESAISHALRYRAANAAVQKHSPFDPRWLLDDMLRKLTAIHDVVLLANFRHAGVPVPDADIAGDDLFQHAPDEVRALYSLHAISNDFADQQPEFRMVIQNSDSAIWIVPEADAATCLKDAKLHLAWFARPSVLELTLCNSPAGFCAALMKPFRAIVFFFFNFTECWVIYTKAGFEISELGLDGPESSLANAVLPR